MYRIRRINAHQKQRFFKGGGEYIKPMGSNGSWKFPYCFWKLSARGVYFGKYGVSFTATFTAEAIFHKEKDKDLLNVALPNIVITVAPWNVSTGNDST